MTLDTLKNELKPPFAAMIPRVPCYIGVLTRRGSIPVKRTYIRMREFLWGDFPWKQHKEAHQVAPHMENFHHPCNTFLSHLSHTYDIIKT